MPRVYTWRIVGWSYLDPSDTTVALAVDIRHLAGTPPGEIVRATARLLSAEGRRLVSEVRAEDRRGLVGDGRHERMIVDVG